MIIKCHDKKNTFTTGETVEKFFQYTNISIGMFHAPFIRILHELHKNAGWQYMTSPKYEEYFNQDLL